MMTSDDLTREGPETDEPVLEPEAEAPEVFSSADEANPYTTSHYLLFGEASTARYDASFDCAGAKAYLEQVGVPIDGQLTQARTLNKKAARYAGFHDDAERYCDFCGRPLTGAEFEKLRDGRDRCMECSATVVRGQENFEALFHQVREGLIEKYGIDLPSGMKVEVVSTKKLARACGKKYVPTKYYDARVVGLATNRRGRYGVMFENGVPRISLTATAAHELTHIWQYTHWDSNAIQKRYGEATLAIYEGMAKWSEIQYLFLINETAQAERSLENEVARADVYGYGLRLFLNEYPLSRGIVLEGDTPFNHVDAPLKA